MVFSTGAKVRRRAVAGGVLAAGGHALVSAVLVVALYLGFQRYLVHGLAVGAASGT